MARHWGLKCNDILACLDVLSDVDSEHEVDIEESLCWDEVTTSPKKCQIPTVKHVRGDYYAQLQED
jgi:hypothetical protein